jgi:hypothetical protein
MNPKRQTLATLASAHCPLVEFGHHLLRCACSAAALYLGFGTLCGSHGVNVPFLVPCTTVPVKSTVKVRIYSYKNIPVSLLAKNKQDID